VELWGFEPQTSCMPYSGNTSTAVYLCRSPSQGVPTSPPGIQAGCCTFVLYVPGRRHHEPSGRIFDRHTARHSAILCPSARPKAAVANGPQASSTLRTAPGCPGPKDGQAGILAQVDFVGEGRSQACRPGGHARRTRRAMAWALAVLSPVG
jgi:hypothetical protein